MEWHIFLILVLNLLLVNCEDAEPKVHGCGGYVKSQFKLEFHQIEIKLFTKQGSLKMKTDCAPQSGYYFIPLDRVGDYILRVHCPEGWTFDPPQYEIKFDGKTDNCSKEIDLNFDFKGFSIYGNVVTAGYSDGPSNVKISLSGPHGLQLETMTGEKGTFSFESIPPGQYVVKATHPDLLLTNDQHSFEITNKNIDIHNKILVNGYTVTGHVYSDSSRPVEGVYLVLYGEANSKVPKQCLTNVADVNVVSDNSISGKVLCLRASGSDGAFQFIGVSPGKYTIVPVYRGKNIVYDVVPEKLQVEVKHESLLLKKDFQVEGFTVQGKVPGYPGASVLINGELKAKCKEDGTFNLARMKPGKYEFQIQSEKVQFDTITIDVNPGRPILPDFSPSRFLVCGVVKGSSSQSLTLNIQSVDKLGKAVGDIRHEAIQDPNNICVFLPIGNYNSWIGSSPNKYFTPSTVNFQIPNNQKTTFEFMEFLGQISGVIICKLGCPDKYTIYLHRKEDGKQIQDKILSGSASENSQVNFNFENVESGTYLISLGVDSKYCWEKDGVLEVTVKDSNVDKLSITQNGFRLKVTSSHDTMLKFLQQGQIVEKEISLKAKQAENICLKTSQPYTLKPTSCHIFDGVDVSVQPGVNTDVMLQAVKHTVSGKIIAMEKIDDLKVEVNGNLLEGAKHVESTKNSRGEFEYKIEFGEVPNNIVTISFLSLGFSFEPSEFEMQTVDTCQLEAFQIVAKKAHILKGKLIPPLEGVQVQVQVFDSATESTVLVTSDSKGEYIAGPFVHSPGFKVTVTPTLSGYIFKPTKEDEFSFTVHQLAKIQVKVEENPGEPLTSVLLSLSGPNAYRQNRYTDANGEMTFTDLQVGQYYLKALLKEFEFEPSAVNIDLGEQETKKVLVKAKRESFSLYGQLFTLNGGITMPNLLISAKGLDDCAEYGEEGVSDESGNFRIWALKSQCRYRISVLSGGELGSKVERTIPSSLEVKVEQEDVKNLSFIVMTPVTRMDVSLRCSTNKDKYLESLKAFVYSTRSPDVPVHKVSFNGYPYLMLPQIHMDNTEYFITFESSLSEFQYKYKTPVINFVANESFAHFDFNFFVEPTPVEQDIGKSSYIALISVFIVIIACIYFETIVRFIKNYAENYSRKNKPKTK